MPRRAVAIDLGASSARFALGELDANSKIDFQIIEQVPHSPRQWNGHEVWDIDFLLGFCQKALKFAKDNGAESIGIDTWGVDHGFIGTDGKLTQPPICYRDHSHVAMFEKMKEHRHWLYAQTGIQHQPFNTIYQLLARKEEQPELIENQWLLLPDLFLYLLGGEPGYERSIATTTQLTDSKGEWHPAVFEKFDLPVPRLLISDPGIAGEIDGIRLARVGGHDTACAVEGMGLSASDHGTVFANIGTWALVGCVKEHPDHSATSEAQNWTNERTPWNDIRYLTNIPGFFILNRLHDDLGIEVPMSDWIETADLNTEIRIDPYSPELYAPVSMLNAVQLQIGRPNLSAQTLCGVALLSLADTIAERVSTLGGKRVVMAGGASNSATLRKLIEDRTGAEIAMGAAEATLIGNFRTQFRILEQER